jgi:hypothetical protein
MLGKPVASEDADPRWIDQAGKNVKLMRRQLSRIVEIKLENHNKKRIHVHVNPF